jgi:hypothetical protein
MFTGGLGMVGSIYDFFTLPRQVREANFRHALLTGTAAAGAMRGPQDWRSVQDGHTRRAGSPESVERIILRLAKQNRGVLTASEVALEANITLDAAKKDLDALVSKGFAELRVRQSGTLVYTLPELMDSDSPLEDF